MKVIELLNKIANGEEVPKKIKYHNDIHILQKSNSTKPLNCYYCKESHCHLFGTFYDYDLNDEVEIIEEDKKIEKIDLSEWAEITYIEDWEMLTKDFNRNCNLFVDKINEIIDYLEENK